MTIAEIREIIVKCEGNRIPKERILKLLDIADYKNCKGAVREYESVVHRVREHVDYRDSSYRDICEECKNCTDYPNRCGECSVYDLICYEGKQN